MGSKQIQTPVDKVSLEFVEKATELIIKIPELVDRCCPECQSVLRGGLRTRTPEPSADINNPGEKSVYKAR